jgi:alkanesulfonate monooxygenase SsuD/methylene tetrahydromethanopterin reductase-like flavin-dependent oxidoreductase (luciferase family)
MGVEFIGIARTADGSEAVTEVGPPVQPDYLYRLARAHERSGFDQLLVTGGAAGPDAFIVADQVLSATTRLGVLLAPRPGAVAPAVAARKLATLGALHPGRVALFGRGRAVSLRPVVAATEAAARHRARQLRELASEQAAHAVPRPPAPGPAGEQAILAGSYEQAARALLRHVAAGASTLLLGGYRPLADAIAYGRLIRLVRDEVGDDLDGYRARAAA